WTSLPVTSTETKPDRSTGAPVTSRLPVAFDPVWVSVITIWPEPKFWFWYTHVPCHFPEMSTLAEADPPADADGPLAQPAPPSTARPTKSSASSFIALLLVWRP